MGLSRRAAHLSCDGALDHARNHLSCLWSLQRSERDVCKTIISNVARPKWLTWACESFQWARRQFKSQHHVVPQL